MPPIVETQQGTLRGFEGLDLDGNRIINFLGIPYAKPPIGKLRFKNPQPADAWSGIRDATKEGNICFQNGIIFGERGGSEDCLYLNVFTRNLPEKGDDDLKPVMVFIHGGAFTEGSNSTAFYGPEFLLTEDIVLVTVNYRLGLLGFLQFSDPQFAVSGNMGFKDQVLSLQWVQDNIKRFNGDPNNVTIFGESAGSASVHYHVVSPMSKGLFHKAIMQSGTVLNPWAGCFDHSPVNVAKLVDSTVTTEREAYEILMELPVEKLTELPAIIFSEFQRGAIKPRALVVESGSSNSTFMPGKPIDFMTSGNYNRVPLMLGYNDHEGMVYSIIKNNIDFHEKLLLEDVLPPQLTADPNDPVLQSLIRKLTTLYSREDDEQEYLIEVMRDYWFVFGIITSATIHARTSPHPVYLYKMKLDTKLNLLKTLANFSSVPGCSHADDLGYLFKSSVTPTVESGSAEEKSLRCVLRLWTNFARYGNPIPDSQVDGFGVAWKPTKPEEVNAFNIGPQLRNEIDPEKEKMLLWREIYQIIDDGSKKYL